MKMKGRKVTAYIASTSIFVILYILTLFIAPQILNIVGIAFIGAITLTAMAFIGGIVYSQFVKSKYYKEELRNMN